MLTPSLPPSFGHHRAPWLLVPFVLIVHLWLAGRLLPEDRFGFGAAEAVPAKIEVAFVRELVPAAPPVTPPRRRAPRRALAPTAPEPAASAPALPDVAAASAAIEPTPDPAPPLEAAPTHDPITAEAAAAAVDLPRVATPPDVASTAPTDTPTSSALAAEPAASVAASVAANAAASAATAFEWPPSTRLSYTLSGNYRGPVEGQASVEWLASGARYQVHLEVGIGPPFALLMSRRISSDGEITADGLVPRRYDEETRMVLREPRRLTIRFDDGLVRLPGGQALVRPSGVQDSASQFVQMTWLFTVRPELLRAGQSIEFPLALPRRVDRWTYDVVGNELLFTPLGAIDAVRVRPRLPQRPGTDLTAEFWVAPTLQNLPVRIVIRQDEETFVDLLLERLPLQAQR